MLRAFASSPNAPGNPFGRLIVAWESQAGLQRPPDRVLLGLGREFIIDATLKELDATL
jgi:hypothetical protein